MFLSKFSSVSFLLLLVSTRENANASFVPVPVVSSGLRVPVVSNKPALQLYYQQQSRTLLWNFQLEATRSEEHLSVVSRKDFLKVGSVLAAAIATISSDPAAAIPPQKSYSTNARNMERLNAGDSSGGSIYDNNPSSPAARKRRAMQGCKIPSARDEAARNLGLLKSLSEKDCNMQVMSSEPQSGPDFMLKALQALECPTCPYGVKQ